MAFYCPQCHTANREGSRFCNNCGDALPTPPPGIPVVTAPAPITEGSSDESAVMEESDVISLDQVPATPTVSRPAAMAAASELLAENSATDSPAQIGEELRPAAPAPALKAAAPQVEQSAHAAPLARAEASSPPAAALPAQGSAPAAPIVAARKDAAPAAAPAPIKNALPMAPPVASEKAATAEDGDAPDTAAWDNDPIAALRGQLVRAPQLLARVRPPASPRPPLPLQASQSPDRSSLWRRLAYLVLATAIVVGVMLPPGTLGSSSVISPEVSDLYATIEALPLRSIVLVSFDYEPGTSDEMQPLAAAVITHLMRRQARILTMSLLPQGPALAGGVMRSLAEQNVYAYGADYVNLGFFSGDEAALASLGSNLSAALKGDDASGRPLTGMTLPRAVSGMSAIDLVIEIAGDEGGAPRWVEQVQTRTGVRLAALTSAVGLPLAFPYRQSGQLSGLASGLPAAAQYEKLMGYTGQATRGMDAQSLGHMAILLFIVLGNLAWLFSRRKAAP